MTMPVIKTPEAGGDLTAAPRPAPRPIYILTGFLGSGKTSFLNRVLRHPGFKDAAVMINEWGEIAIDHHLVEHENEAFTLLENGCICCTLRTDVVDGLQRLETTGLPFQSVILETSGIADPVPLVQTLVSHSEIAEKFYLAGIITIVDVLNFQNSLQSYHEAHKQIALADLILLTKLDMLDDGGVERVRSIKSLVRQINPQCEILSSQHEEIAISRLGGLGLYGPQRCEDSVERWLAMPASDGHHHEHKHHDHQHGHKHDEIMSRSIRFSGCLPMFALRLTIESLQMAIGAELLRLKAILAADDDPQQPIVLHIVQHVVHDYSRLDHWPSEDQTSRLVIIYKASAQNDVELFLKAIEQLAV